MRNELTIEDLTPECRSNEIRVPFHIVDEIVLTIDRLVPAFQHRRRQWDKSMKDELSCNRSLKSIGETGNLSMLSVPQNLSSDLLLIRQWMWISCKFAKMWRLIAFASGCVNNDELKEVAYYRCHIYT